MLFQLLICLFQSETLPATSPGTASVDAKTFQRVARLTVCGGMYFSPALIVA